MCKWIWWLTLPLLYVPAPAWADSGVITPGRVGPIDLGKAPNMGVTRSSTVNVPFDLSKHQVIGMPQERPSLFYRLLGLLPDFQVRKKPDPPPQGALPTIQYRGKIK